ncbi:rRNA biogenesis protein rrp36 [Pseudocyphellaria aurata]|nr:rRNA biogenesis protein rrp36 [Pseudocyphellaria aurata]
MPLTKNLQRRIRPLKYENDDEADVASQSPSLSLISNEHPSANKSQNEDASTTSTYSVDPEGGLDEQPFHAQQDISAISFGALVRAQETLGKRKHRSSDDAFIVPNAPHKKPRPYTDAEGQERKAGRKDTRDFSRPSKHAPVELSSKQAVSRRREAVPIKKLDHRDPRFEPINGRVDQSKAKKNYAFLDQYRESEMAELRTSIRQTKDSDTKEKLKQTLRSMESRQKTQEAKDQQQKVVRSHRAKEKELVRQGKKPFYLKRAEQKKLALVERFARLKEKQIDRIIDRRRKKTAGRARKKMPEGRRM